MFEMFVSGIFFYPIFAAFKLDHVLGYLFALVHVCILTAETVYSVTCYATIYVRPSIVLFLFHLLLLILQFSPKMLCAFLECPYFRHRFRSLFIWKVCICMPSVLGGVYLIVTLFIRLCLLLFKRQRDFVCSRKSLVSLLLCYGHRGAVRFWVYGDFSFHPSISIHADEDEIVPQLLAQIHT